MLTVQHKAVTVNERPGEKSCTKLQKLLEGSGKESCHKRRKQILVGGLNYLAVLPLVY